MERLLPTETCDPGNAPSLAAVSVVVPVGPGDDSWHVLISDLQPLPASAETIVVATTAEPKELKSLASQAGLICPLRWLVTEAGRAQQMNEGVRAAAGEFIWILHADTRVPSEAFPALETALSSEAEALYYFDLEFRQDGPSGTRWNTRGVRFRANLLGLPFGDQGFCLRHETLTRLGGFDERAHYGEDHLLVWAARRNGIPLKRIDATLTTSARRYASAGWATTTLTHLWRTARQALPEWWKCVRR